MYDSYCKPRAIEVAGRGGDGDRSRENGCGYNKNPGRTIDLYKTGTEVHRVVSERPRRDTRENEEEEMHPKYEIGSLSDNEAVMNKTHTDEMPEIHKLGE